MHETSPTIDRESFVAVRVCPLEEIPLGLGRAFQIRQRTIAVFRSRTGSIHAMDNRCPHKNGPIADGLLAGDRVVCPLHAFKFNLQSGQCDQPNICALDIFSARIDQDWVVVELPREVV